jgi:DNA-binding MarR family transcriptional regulator
MTRWLDDEQQQAWRAFLGAVQAVQSGLDAQLQRDAGMPHGYYEVLVRLSEAPERRMRMSSLADSTSSSRSRLSHAVGQLEARGWVRREPCPEDRRGQLAVLTDQGFAALEQAAPGHVTAVRELLVDRLTPAQLRALREISEAIMTDV